MPSWFWKMKCKQFTDAIKNKQTDRQTNKNLEETCRESLSLACIVLNTLSIVISTNNTFPTLEKSLRNSLLGMHK